MVGAAVGVAAPRSPRRGHRRCDSRRRRDAGQEGTVVTTLLLSGLADVVTALEKRVDGEVRFDAGSRAAYSTDASNFRQAPLGVGAPRSVDATAAAVAVCHEYRLPVVSRGGGTSLAGRAPTPP